MSFFESIGKKLSKTGQSAVQRTKSMADGARLNALLAEEEKKLGNGYSRLGKQYYEAHRTDPEPCFSEAVAAIRESEARAAELRLQLSLIRGAVRCERCGAENPEQAAYCCGCGAPLTGAGALPEDRVTCGYCGASVRRLNFCTACGRPLQREEAPAEPPAPELPVPSGPETALAGTEPAETEYTSAEPENTPVEPKAEPGETEAEPMEAEPAPAEPETAPPVVCPRCGAQTEADRFFCTTCGAILKDAAAENAPAAEACAAPAAEAPRDAVCPGCGKRLPAELSFCTACGTPLRG